MDIANKGQAKKAAEKMTLNSFYGHALIQLPNFLARAYPVTTTTKSMMFHMFLR